MPSDLDLLMARITEINAKTAADVTDADISVLIAYHRHSRARRAAGYKPTRPTETRVDVLGLLGAKPAPATHATGAIRRT